MIHRQTSGDAVELNKQVTMHFTLSLDPVHESEGLLQDSELRTESGPSDLAVGSSDVADDDLKSCKEQNALTIDSTLKKEPVTFVVGDGNLPPSFEKTILGLKVGDTRSVVLTPDQGFGPHREENVQKFRRDKFEKMASSESLEPGVVINFSDAAKGEVPGVVRSIEAQYVVIDFNHPLAGKSLNFQVEILAVDEPSAPVKMVQ